MADRTRGDTSTGPTGAPSSDATPAGDDRAPNTLLNALVGAVVAIVLSVLPFSTVLGGAVAGYLEGGDYRAGAKVGAISGLVAFVPFVAIAGVVLALVAGTAFPGPGVQVALWISVFLILLVAAIYTVGLGAVGGVLGIYAREEV